MHSVQLLMCYLVSCLSLLVWRLLTNVLIIALKIQPAKVSVTALNDVTITCTPVRSIPDRYSWHRVDGDIPLHSSGQNSRTLTIHRIVPADEGEYYCMGTVFGHCAKSNKAKVIVNGKKLYHTTTYALAIAVYLHIKLWTKPISRNQVTS